MAHYQLGMVLLPEEKLDEAINHFLETIRTYRQIL